MRVLVLAAAVAMGCSSPPPPAPPPAPVRAEAPPPSAPSVPVDAGAPCDLGAAPDVRAAVEARIAKKRGTMATAQKQMVASSHPLATEAGLAVLRAGGTAADAFVATVLVQDVVLPGVTSTAGLAGVLVFDGKTKELTYIHGGLADPIDPARRYKAGDAAIGKHVLVPGAPFAYATLVERFGKKKLADLVEPAAKLADGGFPIDGLYARSIKGNRAKLERSAYGKKTFFKGGEPLAEGDRLELREVAKALRAFGKDRSFFYRGAWAKDAVALANKNGGSLSAEDFATYAGEVGWPMHGLFLDHDVYAGGSGGVALLTSLGALDHLRGGHRGAAPNADADALEMFLRLHRASDALPARRERGVQLSEPDIVRLSGDVAYSARTGKTPRATPGTHSSAAIVVDQWGDVVVGTHTIETLNWGEGLFVSGIPLSTAAPMGWDDATAATRRVRTDPLTSSIAMKDGAVRVALTVYGSGLHPADVQILDAVIGRGLDAEAAVLEPRVGFYAFDPIKVAIDMSKSTVDPRFDPELLCAMRRRGFTVEPSMPGMPAGYVDTGFPTLVTIAPGVIEGMPPDPPHIDGRAAGD